MNIETGGGPQDLPCIARRPAGTYDHISPRNIKISDATVRSWQCIVSGASMAPVHTSQDHCGHCQRCTCRRPQSTDTCITLDSTISEHRHPAYTKTGAREALPSAHNSSAIPAAPPLPAAAAVGPPSRETAGTCSCQRWAPASTASCTPPAGAVRSPVQAALSLPRNCACSSGQRPCRLLAAAKPVKHPQDGCHTASQRLL